MASKYVKKYICTDYDENAKPVLSESCKIYCWRENLLKPFQN